MVSLSEEDFAKALQAFNASDSRRKMILSLEINPNTKRLGVVTGVEPSLIYRV